MKRCGFCIFCDLNGLFNFLHYLFKVRSILFVTMQLFVSQENMLTVDELKIFVDLDIYIYIYIYISFVVVFILNWYTISIFLLPDCFDGVFFFFSFFLLSLKPKYVQILCC